MNKIYVKSKNTRYTIIIGKGSLGILKKQINKLCPRTKKVGLILDKNIPNHFKIKIKKQLKKYNLYVYEFLPNEKLKSFKKANSLLESLIKNNLSRNDTIITVGGGIIGDFGSFVASIYKRGINLITIPSTLLASDLAIILKFLSFLALTHSLIFLTIFCLVMSSLLSK